MNKNLNNSFENAIAMVSLGLLCGWYHLLLMVIYPTLIFFIFVYRSVIAAGIMCTFIFLSIIPLDHKPKKWFTSLFIWRLWRNYFDFEIDIQNSEIRDGQKYMFCDFPHGVFPMGQFLCASVMEEMYPNHKTDGVFCGTGADIVFMFPIMRHIMSWIGRYSTIYTNTI